MTDKTKCYLCHDNDSEPQWCFGCRHYICESHVNNPIFGKHSPDDHDEDDE